MIASLVRPLVRRLQGACNETFFIPRAINNFKRWHLLSPLHRMQKHPTGMRVAAQIAVLRFADTIVVLPFWVRRERAEQPSMVQALA